MCVCARFEILLEEKIQKIRYAASEASKRARSAKIEGTGDEGGLDFRQNGEVTTSSHDSAPESLESRCI